MSEQYKHYSMIIQWSDEDNAYILTVLNFLDAKRMEKPTKWTCSKAKIPHQFQVGVRPCRRFV